MCEAHRYTCAPHRFGRLNRRGVRLRITFTPEARRQRDLPPHSFDEPLPASTHAPSFGGCKGARCNTSSSLTEVLTAKYKLRVCPRAFHSAQWCTLCSLQSNSCTPDHLHLLHGCGLIITLIYPGDEFARSARCVLLEIPGPFAGEMEFGCSV